MYLCEGAVRDLNLLLREGSKREWSRHQRNMHTAWKVCSTKSS
jgi:hypothetical protein